MSCYSVPERILRTLFGGTALWLGTALCCPLPAGEIDETPAVISAPETLSAPQALTEHSAIPAASLENEPADHWDTGPTIKEETIAIDYSYRDDFCQEYYTTFGYEYTYATAEDAYASDFGSQETLPEPADDSCHANPFCCEDDCCWDEDEACHDEYAYDGYNGDAEQVDGIAEEDFCYEFDDYEMYYGYEYDEVEAVEQSAAVAEETADSDEAGWEDYYREDECEFYQDEYLSGMEADDNTAVAEEEEVAEAADADESVAQDAQTEEYEYDYEYDAYEEYEYEYEYEMVGSEQYDETESLIESADTTPVELDLFAWQPVELLHWADAALLQSIESLYREASIDRREALNNYIESLGFDAIDFAYRYERDAEADLLALSEDLPGAAGLTVEAQPESTQPEPTQPHPVVQAMVAAANHSISGVSAMLTVVSEQLAEIPWNELKVQIETIQSASRSSSSDDTATF